MSSPNLTSILIIGGNGSLARTITRRFSANGITVHSVIRSASQISTLEKLGAKPIVQSVEDSQVSDFVALIKSVKPGAVIWSAGAGAGSASDSRIRKVDTEGQIKVVDAVAQAAEEAGTTRRYISISSLEVRDNERKPMPSWYDAEDKNFARRMRPMFSTYWNARLESDRDVVVENSRRKLEYTIIRPGWMSMASASNRIGAGRCNISRQISREDVTTVIELCLRDQSTVGLAFDVAGGDTPIKEAVANAADSFEGYY